MAYAFKIGGKSNTERSRPSWWRIYNTEVDDAGNVSVSCCLFQNSNVENLPPHVLRLVYKEVSALAADPPEGIKIYPSEEDITELHTAIEGPGKDVGIVLLDLIVQVDRKA